MPPDKEKSLSAVAAAGTGKIGTLPGIGNAHDSTGRTGSEVPPAAAAAASAALAGRVDATRPGTPVSDPHLYQGGQNDSGIHWITCTGETDTASLVLEVLRESYVGTPESVRPAPFYEQALRWRCGLQFDRGHNTSGGWRAELRGGVCDQFSGPDLWRLLRQLMLLGRCTRLDPKIDLRFELPSDLIEQAVASCQAGYLCRVRHYLPFPERDAVTNQLVGNGVRFGSGSSVRLVRFYDKGLESGRAPAGHWLRFEGQLRASHANNAAVLIASAETFEAGMSQAAAVLLGIVDFRIRAAVGHLSRCEHPKWWADFVGSVETVRPRVQAEPSNWQTKASWIRDQCGPFLAALAQEAGCSVGEIVEWLTSGVRPGERALHDASTYELAAMKRTGEPVLDFLHGLTFRGAGQFGLSDRNQLVLLDLRPCPTDHCP